MEFSTIGELCTVKGGKRLPKGASLVDYKTDHPYVRISDFENDYIDLNKIKYITDDVHEKISRYIINKGDIFLSIVGTIGLVDIIKENLDSSNLSENAVKIRSKNEELLDTTFMYYYLKSPMGQHEIKIRTVGSTQPKLAITRIRKIPVPLVPIYYQRQIVNILSSIDEKVRVNNETIENLEELSQTLFKHWFIDFEFPDENGNPYKLSGGKMTSSKVGQIPAEFSLGELESLIDIYNTRRKPLSKMERDEQEKVYPYYGATKIIDYVDDYRFNGKYILVGEDGTVKTDKGTPFTQYVTGKFWVSNHAHILKGKNISDEILLLVLNNIDIDPYITGAVQPKLSKKNLLSIEILIAPMELYKRFNAIIEPYYKKILEIEEESLLLSELRDTLLPKLMSGEIELPEALEV